MKLTKIQREIVKAIRQLHRQGEPLNIPAVKRRHPELMAAVYALKPYWGWKQALADAGLGYADIKAELQDFCVCEICKAEAQSLCSHLLAKHGINRDEYQQDYPGAEICSEELRSRMSKMENKDLPHWERIWTDEYVLDRLWERHKRKLPLNHNAVIFQDVRLLSQVQWRFDTYANTLKKIGLNPDNIRLTPRALQTKKEVLDGIARRQRLRMTLRAARVRYGGTKDSDPTLYRGAIRLFGSWQKAIEATRPGRKAMRMKSKYPIPRSVLQEIRRRHQSGLSLSTRAIWGGEQPDTELYAQALQFFGSWRVAFSRAGLRCRRMPPFYLKYATKKSIITEIKRRQQSALSLNLTAVLRERGGRVLHNGAGRLFGSWRKAIEAAGLDYETIQIREKYCRPENVLHEIRRRYKLGLPLTITQLERKLSDFTFTRKARKFFGSWKKALSAAGIRYRDAVPKQPRKYPTKESVLVAIRLRQQNGLPLGGNDVVKRKRGYADRPLYESGRKFFKKWTRAVKCAGLPYPAYVHPKKYPTQEAVITAIQLRQQAKLPMTVRAMQRADSTLYRSCRKFFRTCADALKSAGITRQT